MVIALSHYVWGQYVAAMGNYNKWCTLLLDAYDFLNIYLLLFKRLTILHYRTVARKSQGTASCLSSCSMQSKIDFYFFKMDEKIRRTLFGD